VPVKAKFLWIEISGIKAGSWNTGATPFLRASSGDTNLISLPCNLIDPLSVEMTPVRIYTKVDFSAPVAPSNAWISPG
jgi:hypothetical protein